MSDMKYDVFYPGQLVVLGLHSFDPYMVTVLTCNSVDELQ